MNAGWIWGTPKVKPARQNNFKYRQKLTSSNNNLKLYLRFKPWGTNKHPTGWSYLAASPEAWHPGMPGWRWPSCHRWSGWGPCRPDLRLHGLPSSPERRINEELRMFLKAVEGSIMIGACKKEGNHMFQRSISVCVCVWGYVCVCTEASFCVRLCGHHWQWQVFESTYTFITLVWMWWNLSAVNGSQADHHNQTKALSSPFTAFNSNQRDSCELDHKHYLGDNKVKVNKKKKDDLERAVKRGSKQTWS